MKSDDELVYNARDYVNYYNEGVDIPSTFLTGKNTYNVVVYIWYRSYRFRRI